jgi:pectate lyase
MAVTGVAVTNFAVTPVSVLAASNIAVYESSGWMESCYVEWIGGDSSYTGYNVYVKSASDSDWTKLDDQLIRKYPDRWRADAVGLAAGTYNMKVVPVSAGTEVTADAITTSDLTVTNYDRSGAAFSTKSTYKGAGAYNADGTLKAGAKVIYVTPATAKTVKATVGGAEHTGLQDIIYGLQKGTETSPIDIRIVGMINADDMDSFGSSAEGIQIKGKSAYANLNCTIEGIGEDSGIHGFGMLIRNAGNLELRNFAVMACLDDSVSLDTGNCNVWVHNMDLFYGKTGGDADQAKGDGTVDIKGKSTYVTVSYNHFFDNGKSSLCGMKSEVTSSLITYHHNWFDHSDSRHPRIRTMSVHIYNNYFDGNAKYGVGVTMGASAFVEANYFRNVSKPMMSSGQGSDALGQGTFSGENGGMIKAYNNTMVNENRAFSYYTQNSPASTGYDAYEVTSRNAQVPSSETTEKGGTTYNNFDTDANFGINVSDAQVDDPADVPAKVTTYAGRVNGGDFKWTFDNSTEDANYSVITALKTAVVNYKTTIQSIGGNGTGATDPTTSATTEATTNKDGSTETTTNSQESSTEGTTTAPVEGAQVHNFTLNGTSSSFYSITGKLTKSYGTVSYNGLTLTQALKLETSTVVAFDPDGVAGTLTIVTNPQYSGTIELNDKAITIGSDGVATISLDGSQSYQITKGSGSNYIFYIAYTPNGSTPTVIKGDADDSGKVDAADVTMIMDFAVGKISAVTNATNADVTGDKTVDVDDAYKISQFLNGLIKSL